MLMVRRFITKGKSAYTVYNCTFTLLATRGFILQCRGSPQDQHNITESAPRNTGFPLAKRQFFPTYVATSHFVLMSRVYVAITLAFVICRGKGDLGQEG